MGSLLLNLVVIHRAKMSYFAKIQGTIIDIQPVREASNGSQYVTIRLSLPTGESLPIQIWQEVPRFSWFASPTNGHLDRKITLTNIKSRNGFTGTTPRTHLILHRTSKKEESHVKKEAPSTTQFS